MNFQGEMERLEGLFRSPKENESEIMRIYFNIIKTGGSDASNVIPFLNQKAVHLLSPQVIDILNKNRLDAYGYLLVAHNMWDLEDIKDDLLKGDVLANAIPPNTIRKLKSQLGHSSSTTTTTSTATLSAIPRQLNPMETLITSDTIPIAPQTTYQPHQHEEMVITSGENVREHGEITSRLPIQIRNLCTNKETIEGLILLKLPLKMESTFEGASSIVKRFSFGEPDTSTNRKSKTILLMGATGSGKTTMINAMINYVLGVEWDDPFRFLLVDEQVIGASQANSQTQKVTAYDIHYKEGFRIPFSLTIVDTPGFGDTGGMGRDKEITSAIQEFFENSNGIQVKLQHLVNLNKIKLKSEFNNAGIGCRRFRRPIRTGPSH
jgi:GTP-binding protein EngB required for normal cell division